MTTKLKNGYFLPKVRCFCIALAISSLVACAAINTSPQTKPVTDTAMTVQSTAAPQRPMVATSTAFTAVPTRLPISQLLFIVLSEDQTQLLAAYEGQPYLQVLYQISPPGRVEVWYHPAGFPVVSHDGNWVTVIEDSERGTTNIYRIALTNPDKPKLILDWRGPQSEATISPDGKRVAFFSSEGECPESKEYGERRRCYYKHVYVMDSDGNNIKRLTTNAADRCFLTWSPNSTQIVYREICDPVESTSTPPQIYVLTLEPHNSPKRVTQITASGVGGMWSPNGEWLQWRVFRNGVLGNTWLSRLNAEGKIVTETDVGLQKSVVWSPDSKRLADIAGDGTITVWDIESSKTTTVQLLGVAAYDPQKWLLDGKRLVFRGQRIDAQGTLGEGQWFMVGTDGTNLVEFKSR